MSKNVLIVTVMDGAANLARVIEEQLGTPVDVAPGRREALTALRRSEYGVVVVEENLTETDPDWAEQVWVLSGLAMPVMVNFSIAGSARLTREVKAALSRRTWEERLARRSVTQQIENELKSSVTGLLLESELALREPSVPASLAPRLRHLVELAGALRLRLKGEAESRA